MLAEQLLANFCVVVKLIAVAIPQFFGSCRFMLQLIFCESVGFVIRKDKSAVLIGEYDIYDSLGNNVNSVPFEKSGFFCILSMLMYKVFVQL